MIISVHNKLDMITFTYRITDNELSFCTINSDDFKIKFCIYDLDELNNVTLDSFNFILEQQIGLNAVLRISLNINDNKLRFSLDSERGSINTCYYLSDADTDYLINAIFNFQLDVRSNENLWQY